jgi:hypothetical protein
MFPRPSIARPTAKSNSAPRFSSPLDQIVAAVRDNGKPVEYLAGPNAGHSYAQHSAMESFLAKYLGGRCQEDVPIDVAAVTSTQRNLTRIR